MDLEAVCKNVLSGPRKATVANADHGGSAYPCPGSSDGSFGPHNEGMSLRDFFASGPISEQELGLLKEAYFDAFPETVKVSTQQLRFFHADRMIKERRRPSDLQCPAFDAMYRALHAVDVPEETLSNHLRGLASFVDQRETFWIKWIETQAKAIDDAIALVKSYT